MVTWGNNTTAVFGTSAPANAPTTPAPAAAGAFSFGAPAATPSTPPSASQKPAVNPPPLGGAAPASSGFSFGASAPAPSTGGLFGSTTTPAPAPTTGGLFGSTSSFAAPAPSTSLFGTTTPAAAPSTSLFGSTPQQPQPQPTTAYNPNPHQAALHAHQSASQRQEAARLSEAISNLHAKYSPHTLPNTTNPPLPSSLCAFSAILYDPLPPQHRNTNITPKHLSIPKPPHLSNQAWNESLARNPNPNELIPVSLVGSQALHSRIVEQQSKAQELHSHVMKLKDTLQFLQTTATRSRERIQVAHSTQVELNRRLLEIMRKVEVVRCMNQPIQSAEEESVRRLRRLSDQVESVARTLVTLEERGRAQARSWRKQGVITNNSAEAGMMNILSEEDKLALFHVLNDQRLGMERLGEIVMRDGRDMEILKEEMGNVEMMSGRRQKRVVGGVGPAIFGGR